MAGGEDSHLDVAIILNVGDLEVFIHDFHEGWALNVAGRQDTRALEVDGQFFDIPWIFRVDL